MSALAGLCDATAQRTPAAAQLPPAVCRYRPVAAQLSPSDAKLPPNYRRVLPISRNPGTNAPCYRPAGAQVPSTLQPPPSYYPIGPSYRPTRPAAAQPTQLPPVTAQLPPTHRQTIAKPPLTASPIPPSFGTPSRASRSATSAAEPRTAAQAACLINPTSKTAVRNLNRQGLHREREINIWAELPSNHIIVKPADSSTNHRPSRRLCLPAQFAPGASHKCIKLTRQ